MGETRKQRNARRVREKLAKELRNSKAYQIKQMQHRMERVESLPTNIFTGEVMWPSRKEQ